MRNKYSLFFFTIFLVSCNTSTKPIVINNELNKYKNFKIEILDASQLEKSDSSIVGNINIIQIYNNYIYILESITSKSLICFSANGKFVFRTKIGFQNGELHKPQDFQIKNNRLYILDHPYIKLFSLTGGFIKSLNIGEGLYFSNFILTNFNNVLIYSNFPALDDNKKGNRNAVCYQYHELDTNFTKELGTYLPVFSDYYRLGEFKPFAFFENHYLLSHTPYNSIYCYSENQVFEKYIITFSDYSITDKDVLLGLSSYVKKIDNGLRYGMIDDINETKNYVTFSYIKSKNNIKYSVYSKMSGSCADFYDILKNNNLPKMHLKNTFKNDFICTLFPNEIENQTIKVNGRIIKLVANEETLQNPIILIVRIIENH